MNWPKTLEEAKAYRYDVNSYSRGNKWDPFHCAAEVKSWSGWHWLQCERKPGYGPHKLFCKQHAKIVERY